MMLLTNGQPHLVPPRGDDHGLQPLVGHAQVEGGQLAQLTGDAFHNLGVNLGNLVLKIEMLYKSKQM